MCGECAAGVGKQALNLLRETVESVLLSAFVKSVENFMARGPGVRGIGGAGGGEGERSLGSGIWELIDGGGGERDDENFLFDTSNGIDSQCLPLCYEAGSKAGLLAIPEVYRLMFTFWGRGQFSVELCSGQPNRGKGPWVT